MSDIKLESIYAGRTVMIPSGPKGDHLFFCAIDPKLVNRHLSCLLLPLCSLHRRADQTCVLSVGEHSFIKHESYISYAQARVDKVIEIVEHINAKNFKLGEEDASKEVQEKILAGLAASARTPRYIKYDWL